MKRILDQRARRFDALYTLLTGVGRSASLEALTNTDHLRRDTGLAEVSAEVPELWPRF